ncbi:hypothetical protein Tco_0857854 [Tanacetum coccineum]|uniref:Uncharacterized protein n=1 Tax=Tanacetum coccineum TaxID=301880 RepID=A0ABQ5BAR9_9ASTR
MYMNSWDKLSLESYKEKCEKLEKENKKYIITFSSLYDNDRQYTKKIKEQEDLIDTMSDQLAELNNTIKIQQTTISELKECLLKKDSENEHLKSKVVDFTTVQNLQVQVKELQSKNEHLKSKVVDCSMCQNFQVQVVELKSVNKSLNLSVEELYKARALADDFERKRLIDFCSVESELNNLEKVYKTKESVLLKDIDQKKSQISEHLEKLKISDQEMKQQIILFEEDKQMFLAKNEFLEKVSSSVQKEYNDLLVLNDVLKQRLETKFKFLKHDNSLEKMVETIEKEYESNVSTIFITSSTFESKNLELVKEMGDKVKCFDEEKKAFETKIAKLEKVLAQRVKDFADVKTELSKRTDKFETYFANLEKQNALLKSQLASQNYTSLQKENNDLRTSYNVLKEKYETSCKKLEKENNDLKMHYKRLFDSIKQKKVVSPVFTNSIPKENVSEKIYTDRKYLKKQHSSETFASPNHVKNENSKQAWKRKEIISKPFMYSRDEMFSMRKRDDSVLEEGERSVCSLRQRSIDIAVRHLHGITSQNSESLGLQTTRFTTSNIQEMDMVIEGEALKEYEDSVKYQVSIF